MPRAPCALAMTEAERICVSFRDQSADWSWESVIPLCKSKGERIATASVRTGFAMTWFFARNAVGRDDVGSELSAAGGRGSEVSEWPRSKF